MGAGECQYGGGGHTGTRIGQQNITARMRYLMGAGECPYGGRGQTGTEPWSEDMRANNNNHPHLLSFCFT